MKQTSPEPSLTQLEELLKTMRKLRSKEGCDWDRAQTPQSLRPYILEEAYELVDAIDGGDNQEICSELGDLLLQIVFQAQMFSEQGIFDFADVAEAINTKLIRRHPHIFNSGLDVQHPSWEEIKQQELKEKGKSAKLQARLPTNLPALKQAAKVSRHLTRNGSSDPVTHQDKPLNEEELGLRLFELVQCGEAQNIDADIALRRHLLRLLNSDQDVGQNGDL